MTLKTPEQIQSLIARAYAMRLQLIIRSVMPERLTPNELRLARYWADKPIF
jgi:hypothetical protein